MKTRIITIILALLSMTASHAAEGIQIASTTLKPGETKDITLTLSQNSEKYAGIQFDIKLPEGLSLVATGSEVYYAIPSNQANDLTCNVTNTEQNAYRFMLYSNSLKLFKSGDLLTLRLKAETGIALKEYTIELNDVRLSDIDGAVTKLGNSTATVKVTDFFKLIYMVDGTEYKTVEYEYGATITPEAAPTKEGYTFSGWKDLPSTMPAKDVTVTGTFTANKYKLIYMVDGVEYKSYEIKYGSTITPEAEPKKDGYTFSGWSNIPETMPAHDVTVTGTFTKNMTKGDANGDGAVNAADIVEVVNYIMGSPSAIFDNKAADVNGDGVVNAADIVEIVKIIMAAG